MKFLLVLGVVVLAYLLWRNQRVAATRRRPPSKAPRTSQDMLACAFCGVHVPRSDAVMDGDRSYCCTDHQKRDAH